MAVLEGGKREGDFLGERGFFGEGNKCGGEIWDIVRSCLSF